MCSMKVLEHVMAREKICRALDSCFGLVGPHQQSIPQLLSPASLSPATRVYKGYHEHRTCGSELMRFIPTRLCHRYICAAYHAQAFVVWSLGPSPLLLVKASTEPKPDLAIWHAHGM